VTNPIVKGATVNYHLFSVQCCDSCARHTGQSHQRCPIADAIAADRLNDAGFGDHISVGDDAEYRCDAYVEDGTALPGRCDRTLDMFS
jgi:hypothetical protein